MPRSDADRLAAIKREWASRWNGVVDSDSGERHWGHWLIEGKDMVDVVADLEEANQRVANLESRLADAATARDLAAGIAEEAKRERDEAKEEAKELQQTFDLQWKADRRAVEMWQKAHPERSDIWPDRADLCVWLMEQLAIAQLALDLSEQTDVNLQAANAWKEKAETAEIALAEARAALRPFAELAGDYGEAFDVDYVLLDAAFCYLTVGQLRAAQKVLSSPKEPT